MILFVVGLCGAGSSLGLFFIAYTQFFRETWWLRGLSWLGTLAGAAAGMCFIGVALTPANLSQGAHGQFVLWAFRLFLAAVCLYLPALALGRQLPRRSALVFLVFAALLAGYIALLTNGPKPNTPEGLVIQAVGQKTIVYASIVSVGVQALGAARGRPDTGPVTG